MRYILPLLLILPFTAGCSPITRTEYEQANAGRLTYAASIKLDNGDQRVFYSGLNPQIDPSTLRYSCPHGMRIIDYRNDIIVGRMWRDDQ